MTPAGYEGIFEANERLGEDADPAVQERVNADHEVTYVGPPLKVKLGLA
jgi:hypothetical protein